MDEMAASALVRSSFFHLLNSQKANDDVAFPVHCRRLPSRRALNAAVVMPNGGTNQYNSLSECQRALGVPFERKRCEQHGNGRRALFV